MTTEPEKLKRVPPVVKSGMKVTLVTVCQGVDDDGVEAIGPAFAPIHEEN